MIVFVIFFLGAVFGSLVTAAAATIGVDLTHWILERFVDRRLRIDGRLPSGRVIHLEGWRRR